MFFFQKIVRRLFYFFSSARTRAITRSQLRPEGGSVSFFPKNKEHYGTSRTYAATLQEHSVHCAFRHQTPFLTIKQHETLDLDRQTWYTTVWLVRKANKANHTFQNKRTFQSTNIVVHRLQKGTNNADHHTR